jgi:hypothetical protein
MKTDPASNVPRNSNLDHPPLAYDAQGHPLAMPDAAAWWVVKRHTTGRPKAILGPDRRPLRWPLDTTADELAAMCGPGIYRLDALDELGNSIDHVTTLEIGDDDSVDDGESRPKLDAARAGGGDLRFALETIMQMARAQSDSLRAVSEAQADWVKGLANAKALPRNALHVPPPALLSAPSSDDDEDDDDEAPALPAYAVVAQAAQGIVHDLPNVVQAFTALANLRNAAGQASVATAAARPLESSEPVNHSTGAPDPMVHLSEINERLTGPERRFLRRVLRGAGADAVIAELLARTADDAATFVKEQIAQARAEQNGSNDSTPPHQQVDFNTHVMAVAALLSADERAAVLALLPRLRAERVAQVQAQLLAMTPPDAAAWVRENLASLSAEVAP